MKLLIAIPAYNEEGSIAATITRALKARERLLNESPVSAVDITVVSDGSTDRTVELSRAFGEKISLIEFEHNRGYGAAIKCAWGQSDADLLGILDADGTCDPEFFVELCCAIEREQADIALGSRLHSSSEIPVVRRIGNMLFAALVTTLSSNKVRDAASGMRVVRKSSIPKVLPLPDGLNFTPAMSARAAMSRDLKVVELDMPYHERVGKSKLRVIHDGLRFLRVIVETALIYRPSRILMIAGGVSLVAAVTIMSRPAHFYLLHRHVLEWMIYRFVVAELLTLTGTLLVCGGYIAGRVSTMTIESGKSSAAQRRAGAFLRSRWFWLVTIALVFTGGALVFPAFVTLVRTGATYEHWSRFIAMSTLVGVAIVLCVVRLLDFVLDLLNDRVAFMREQRRTALMTTANRE